MAEALKEDPNSFPLSIYIFNYANGNRAISSGNPTLDASVLTGNNKAVVQYTINNQPNFGKEFVAKLKERGIEATATSEPAHAGARGNYLAHNITMDAKNFEKLKLGALLQEKNYLSENGKATELKELDTLAKEVLGPESLKKYNNPERVSQNVDKTYAELLAGFTPPKIPVRLAEEGQGNHTGYGKTQGNRIITT